MVSNAQLSRAVQAARAREAEGYFHRVAAGDQRAASLFARLVAHDLNPNGLSTEYGWLTKQPGESQVDGYAEDAIVFGADPNDLANVVDLVNGAGAAGASIGGSIKERRPANRWAKPLPLTAEEMAYLFEGVTPQPEPVPAFPYPDEPTAVLAYEKRVAAAYHAIGRKFPDEQDPDAFRHFARYGYSCSKMAEPEAANKHIKELRAELGAPPE